MRWIEAVNDIQNRVDEAAPGKAWLAMALAAGRMALWGWTPASNEWRWSEEGYQLYGAKPGMTRSELDDFIHPNDRLKVIAARAQGASTGVDVTYRILRASGDIRWLRSTGSAIPGSEPLRLAGCVVDVTDLARSNSELPRQMRGWSNSIPPSATICVSRCTRRPRWIS